MSLRGAEMLACGVEDDAMKTRGKSLTIVKHLALPIDEQKALLNDIFGDERILYQGIGDPHGCELVAPH